MTDDLNANLLSESASAESEKAMSAFMEVQFVEFFLLQNRRAQLSIVVTCTLFFLVWVRASQPMLAGIWLATVVIVSILRIWGTRSFVLAQGAASALPRIGVLFLINGLLMAVPLLAFNSYSELERAMLSIVLTALATGGIATTNGVRHIFFLFAAPMLIPLGLVWVLSDHANGERLNAYVMGGLIGVYLLFLKKMGQDAFLAFEQSCKIRFGEAALNRKLNSALEVAREANRAKTQFLAAASHDLRQPMQSMNVLLAALNFRPLDERSKEIVSLLGSVNQAVTSQLDGLLDISKLDAGIVKPQFRTLLLNDLVSSHVATLTDVAKERNLTLKLDKCELVTVVSDPALLARIISNITDNALKFTQRGSIVLSVTQANGIASICVADTGIGIPIESQQLVFREFYQVENLERDRAKGLGLGLSIVQRLCGLLGITLSMQSVPGQGTAINLSMAAVENFFRPNAYMLDLVRPGLAVLVIDDEKLVRESLRFLLEELGCFVFLAADRDQALAVVQQQVIDVVFSDFRLRDGESGLLLIEAIRRLKPRARFLLITGDTDPERLREASAVNVPVLHKPISLEHLTSAMKNL